MNNVLIAIGVLIVAVLSALFAIPAFVDWNSYRGVIEEEASRIVGRDVRISGDINLQLLPAPSFVVQKLRIADATAGTGEPLFRADRVHAKLSIVPLVRGVLEANEIELVRPSLRLSVDEAGKGNWRDLVRGHGALPFVPNDVALQAMRITDGTLNIFDRNGTRERLSLARVSGVLSAPALEGPYRFRGAYGGEGAERELRFTTLPPDADGNVGLKGTVKDLAGGASASFDGRLRNLSGYPGITGELTALLPLPGTKVRPAASSPASATTGSGTAQSHAELKAEVLGDANTIALKNLSIAFENEGRPEVVAGAATFAWGNELTTTVRLAAPWINLDPVLGNPEGGNPILALAAFAQRINGIASGAGAINASLDIEQANLGHDLVGGIRIEARSTAGMLAIEELRASLPGASRLAIQGRITGEAASTTFDGDVTLRGTSMARLAAWATGGKFVVPAAHDRPYTARSRVLVEPGRSALRDAQLMIGDSPVLGSVDFVWSGQRRLRVALDGMRIDARAFLPSNLTLGKLGELLLPTAPAAQPNSGSVVSAPPDATRPIETNFTLKAAELILPDQALKDVAVSASTSALGISIQQLQFSGEHGVSVALDGLIADRNGTSPSAGAGTSNPTKLRGAIAAGDEEGIAAVAAFLGFPVETVVPARLHPQLVPLRLAGTFTRSRAGATGPVEVVADGDAGRASIKLRAALAGGLQGWRGALADIDVVVLARRDAGLIETTLGALLNSETGRRNVALPALSNSAGNAGQARLAVRASGMPADGMATAVRLDSQDANVQITGRTVSRDGMATVMTGDIAIDARDARDLLTNISGGIVGGSEPLPIRGAGRIDARAGQLLITDLSLMGAANSRQPILTGQLSLASMPASAEGVRQRKLSGDVHFVSLSSANLLAPVLQSELAEGEAAKQALSGRAKVWPDANFSFSRAGDTEISVKISSDVLAIAPAVSVSPALSVSNARFVLLTRPDAFEIRDFAGTVLGGRLAANAVFERHAAGATLAAKFEVGGARLDAFGATGTADGVLMLSGRGASPAGLVGGLTGTGSVNLGAATVKEVTPNTLRAAVDEALAAPPEKVGTSLRAGLAAEPARAALPIGPRSLSLTLQDGTARVQPIVVETQSGRATVTMAVDLGTFRMSGDWRIETSLPPSPTAAVATTTTGPGTTPVQRASTSGELPPIIRRYDVLPSDLESGRTAPRSPYDVDALERELAVRKVERDLAELERLRRLDEERAAARASEQVGAVPPGAAAPSDWTKGTETRPAIQPSPTGAPPAQ